MKNLRDFAVPVLGLFRFVRYHSTQTLLQKKTLSCFSFRVGNPERVCQSQFGVPGPKMPESYNPNRQKPTCNTGTRMTVGFGLTVWRGSPATSQKSDLTGFVVAGVLLLQA